MRDKLEQVELSYKRIDEQAKELIEVYVWDKDFVDQKAKELKDRVIPEVRSFGDMEDLSGCWSLIYHISNTRTNFNRNFKTIESSDKQRYYELLQITGEIANAFRYIPENNLETLDIYAGEVENGTDEPNGYVFAIKTGDTKYYPWSIEVVEESFKEHGAFKVAKKMYETFMKDDLGIEV